jgi:predicted enzyme related to lactoylglutathione lyase
MQSPSADSTLVHAVPVTDLRRAHAWYRDALRAIAAPDAGESVAFLGTHVQLIPGGQPSHEAIAIAVADCRSAYEALRERGVHFLTEPIERGPDTRCTFRDPDGNRFELRELRG